MRLMLPQTDPQGLQEHLNTVAKNGGAEHLYVDSDKLKAALDETHTQPETLATLAPALARHAAEVEAGRSNGGKQPIKTGDYLARLAKTPLGQSLAPHLQLAPDALSQEQTRAYFTHQQQTLTEATQHALSQSPHPEAVQASREAVQQTALTDLAHQDDIPTEMHEQAAQYIADIATVVAHADGTTPEAAYARLSEEPTEANPTQGQEETSGSVVGQGALTTEAAGQNAEPASPAATGTDPSSIPIPDSTNQLPTDSIPSASAKGAGYNDPQAAGEEKAGAEGVAANSVGVPVTRSTNPLSPVCEFDALGNEITYRTMSPAQAKQFELTGQLPATTETSTAASLKYASGKYT
jgi:hypothetical protein